MHDGNTPKSDKNKEKNDFLFSFAAKRKNDSYFPIKVSKSACDRDHKIRWDIRTFISHRTYCKYWTYSLLYLLQSFIQKICILLLDCPIGRRSVLLKFKETAGGYWNGLDRFNERSYNYTQHQYENKITKQFTKIITKIQSQTKEKFAAATRENKDP